MHSLNTTNTPLLFRALFWIACTAVLILSLSPIEHLTASIFNWWDKAQHASAFAVLCVLGMLAYRNFGGRVMAGLLVYGIAIELAQHATGWRFGDLNDFLADSVGVALGGLATRTIRQQS